MELRVKHGIREELLPLVAIRGIGRVRARRLFNNNIKTAGDLKRAGRDKVAQILGGGIADQIFGQLNENKNRERDRSDETEPDAQATLEHFG